jgi:hypothetical protein
MLFCENASQSSEENEEAVKIFYNDSCLIIGARGAVLRTRLDSTVARFPGDACPLRHSEGDVFLLKF